MPTVMKRLPDLDALKLTFSYDPRTGEVRYLDELPHIHPAVRARCAGRIAGALQEGRRSIGFSANGVRYRLNAYRVGWALFYGADPYPFEIDHIDGDPGNNRITNLRIATRSENMRNTIGRPTVRGLDVKGVRFRKGAYEASICLRGSTKYLGRYNTLEAAEEAYKSAAQRLHGAFAKHLSAQVGG